MLPGDVDSLLDTAPADIVIRITYRNTLYTLGKQTNQPPAYRTIDGPQQQTPRGPYRPGDAFESESRSAARAASHWHGHRGGARASHAVARRAHRGPGHTMIYLFIRITTVILMVTGIT